jgi:hypothetical protein
LSRRLKEWLRRLPSMPFPWPGKTSRHAAIAAARRERLRSRGDAERADILKRQIEAMRQQNHFAALLTDDIVRRHMRENGEDS